MRFAIKLFYQVILILIVTNSIKGNTNIDSLLNLINEPQHDSILIERCYKLAKAYQKESLPSAIKYADKGIALSKLHNDSLNIALGLFLSGSYYSELGIYNNALNRLTQSNQTFVDIKDTNRIIESLGNIGNVFWFQNDYNMALKLYKQAYNHSIQSNSHKLEAIRMNIAICYSYLGKPDSAYATFQDILKNIHQLDNGFSKGLTYLNIGSTYLLHKQVDSALFYLLKSQEYEKHLPNVVVTQLKASIAHTYVNLGLLDLANQYLDSCYSLAKSDSSLLSFKEYYLVKFDIDTTLKNYKSAVNSHIELSRINDSIFNNENDQRFNDYKAYFELQLKEKEIEYLRSDNELYKSNAKKKQIVIILLFIIVSLGTLLIIIYKRLHSINRKVIKSLNIANKTLLLNKDELSEKNDELNSTLDALKETQNQLLQSEKLASIGVLAAGVAHEINNPLNYINGGILYLNEIEDQIKDKHTLQKYKQAQSMIEEGVGKANNVVNTLGKFAFSSKTQLNNEELNELIDDAIDKISFKVFSTLQISKNFADLPTFKCDKKKVENIVIQILSNAIDACKEAKEENSEIFIETSICIIDNNKHFNVSVSNSGKHINESNINKLFDPFFTTKDPDLGYGLGLSIAYNLVDELNGSIRVKNIPNGVNFNLSFPITN